ncbi:MAG: hypothetical protein IT381_03595 [Deltaproteobacteria bacterium]|nr:hypothetical protein [Deltaproteobacteria bacterium]
MAIEKANLNLYPGVNAQTLSESVGQSSEDKQQEAVAGNKLKQVLSKIAQKTEENKKDMGLPGSGRASEKTVETLFKGLLDGKSGPVAKDAAQTFQSAQLSKDTNSSSQEFFGKAAQGSPQAGFNAASSFKRTSDTPGADRALGSSASEVLVTTTQTAQKGGDLKELESTLGDLISKFKDGGTAEPAKKKVVQSSLEAPGSERHKAAMEWAGSKTKTLQNGPAQEKMANLLQKADPKNPAQFKDTLKTLEKFASDPSKLSKKLDGADAKQTFSQLSSAMIGSPKLAVSEKAFEKLLDSEKFANMKPDTKGKLIATLGKSPQHAPELVKTLDSMKGGPKLEKFAKKVAARGLDPESMKQSAAEAKTRTIPFPAIENLDPRDPETPKKLIAFKAQWGAVAQKTNKFNGEIAKGLNKATSLRQLNELPTPRGLGPITGGITNPEELAQKLGCSVDQAKILVAIEQQVEDNKRDLGIQKNLSTKRRSLRGKPDSRPHLKEKRSDGPTGHTKTTIALSEDAARSSTGSLRQLLGRSGAATKTEASASAETEASTTATPPPTREEVAARNSQAFRPTSSTMNTRAGRMQWGNNTIQVGMDAEVQRKKLAKMREEKAETLKADPTKLSKGPRIGTDFSPLSDIVANNTPWVQLKPGVKAALRNLQITPNILESWQGNKPIYSTLQAKEWDSLNEIQRKSAQLVSLTPDNWNALASVLSAAMKNPQEIRRGPTKINLTQVTAKGNA